MQKLIDFFKSVKLAVVLLIIIVVTSIIATLIQQDRELAFYYHTYSQPLAWLIIKTQFNSFFRSFLFITSIVLFSVNLSVCSIDRIYREITKKRRRRYGPDLIHIGLLILLVGGLISAFTRVQGSWYMASGEETKLPNGYVIQLESFEFLAYENGRPKDWISTVDVFKDGELVIDSFPIEVNNPLKAGKIEVYQTSYGEQPRAELLGPDGSKILLGEGEYIETDTGALVLAGIDYSQSGSSQYAAVFEEWINQERNQYITFEVGETFENFELKSVGIVPVTGLQAVKDPGYLAVLIGLIMAGVGLFLTYYQKFGDREI